MYFLLNVKWVMCVWKLLTWGVRSWARCGAGSTVAAPSISLLFPRQGHQSRESMRLKRIGLRIVGECGENWPPNTLRPSLSNPLTEGRRKPPGESHSEILILTGEILWTEAAPGGSWADRAAFGNMSPHTALFNWQDNERETASHLSTLTSTFQTNPAWQLYW